MANDRPTGWLASVFSKDAARGRGSSTEHRGGRLSRQRRARQLHRLEPSDGRRTGVGGSRHGAGAHPKVLRQQVLRVSRLTRQDQTRHR